MSKRKRKDYQGELFITPSELASGEGHAFYEQLNAFLTEHEFGKQLEDLCREYYDDGSQGIDLLIYTLAFDLYIYMCASKSKRIS